MEKKVDSVITASSSKSLGMISVRKAEMGFSQNSRGFSREKIASDRSRHSLRMRELGGK